jgi:hypothetical protein
MSSPVVRRTNVFRVAIAPSGGTIRLVTKRRRRVLNGIHSCSVLNVIVALIHHIENLYLQGDCGALSEIEAAGHSEVDLLCPRSVERIQSGKRAGVLGIDAEGGVWRALERCGVVHRIRQRADA